METWFIILGVINILLFFTGIKIFIPKKFFSNINTELYTLFKKYFPYLFIIIGVVIFHLVEVNIIDPIITRMIGRDFADFIQKIEGDKVILMSQYWTPLLVYFFVFIYIAIYPFFLWFSPLYFILTDEKKPLKMLSYGLLLIYAISLPFYLFLPITNVYKHYGINSALESVIPTIDSFFYATTTQNNTLPSLHVAMSILIVWSIYLTRNKTLTYFGVFCMILVIFSVIYLVIHWIIDVISGILLALGVIFILQRFIKEK